MRELGPPDCVLEYFGFTLNEDDSEMLILSSGCRGEHAGPPFQSSPESTKDPAAVDEKLEHLGTHTQEGVCGLDREKSPESTVYPPQNPHSFALGPVLQPIFGHRRTSRPQD